jgi:hypothetical protein
MTTLAQRIFDAKKGLEKGEEELVEALEGIGITDLRRLEFDEYDDSFEAYVVTPFDVVLTPEKLAQIWALGFDRFWIHKGDQRVLGPEREKNERYFWRGKP